jgi:hypothetical protein
MRNDKTCLNCRYVVENRFCPNCDNKKHTEKRFTFIFLKILTLRKCFWRTKKFIIQTLQPKNISQVKIVLFSWFGYILLVLSLSIDCYFS